MAKTKKKPTKAKAKPKASAPRPATAKADRYPMHPDVGPTDFVRFNDLTDPLVVAASTFTVTGTASPSTATVNGILTDTASGATFASNPASVTCVAGTWHLDFQSIPPGSY